MKNRKLFENLVALQAILNEESSEKKSALLKHLPEEQIQIFEDLPDLPKGAVPEREKPLCQIVHWSWHLPILEKYNQQEQKLFLSVLEPNQFKNLVKNLTLSSQKVDVPKVGIGFLQEELKKSLLEGKKSLLPKRLVPNHGLNELLWMDKKALSFLIDLLAIYDLGVELKQVVDTKILKGIYALLNEEEKSLLKKTSNHKDPFSFGKMGIDRWDGSEQSLRTLLHRRGIIRFSKGLSGQDPDFTWYICHQLDIGRGKALEKGILEEQVPHTTSIIVQQIKELL